MNLAFIGTGVMGASMAGHLLSAGHALAVHNRTRSKAEGLVARGARWAEAPGDAARGAEVVFLCVSDTPDVRQAVLGEGGVLAGLGQGAIVVDHSTISPAATREIAAAVMERGGAGFLDAPVSGGDIGARNATLSIMVGGDAATLARVDPLLRLMGKNITHAGPVGAGQLTKLVNQILVTVNNLATCEALAFAGRNGLDLNTTIAAISGGAAGSWQLANVGPRMAKGDFAPGFTIDLQQKDLRLVLEAAEASHTPLPATALVKQLFTSAQAAGLGQEGTQALYKVVKALSGK